MCGVSRWWRNNEKALLRLQLQRSYRTGALMRYGLHILSTTNLFLYHLFGMRQKDFASAKVILSRVEI